MLRISFVTVIASLLLSFCVCSQSARLLPPAPPTQKDLIVVDWQVNGIEDRVDDLSVRSLQGLVNRDRARVWVGTDTREGSPGWWLAKYQEMGLVTAKPRIITKDEFLMRYKRCARGVVVPPANLGPGGYRVAVMKAAADGLIVGSRELANKLGLEVVEDYTTRFNTYAESWQYALDNLWDKLSGKAIFVDREDLAAGTSTVDYVVQHKLFLCAPHVDDPGEMPLFQKTIARLPHNSPLLGSVGGKGLYSEGDLIRAVSKAGCVFAGCSAVQNLSVHAGFTPSTPLKQPMRERPKLDPTKAYIAVELSDGDNANVFFSHIPRRGLWEKRGQVPLGWTICQTMAELAPAITSYYYSTRTPLDEFITGVSGYAYIFPGDFGNALTPVQKEDAWREFLNRTNDFLSTSDIKTITTIHYREKPGPVGADVFSRYAKGLNNAAGIINGYNAVYNEYGGKTHEIIDDLPVFHTVTDRTWSDATSPTLADDVIARTPKERPAFIALFMLPMALGQDHFEQVVDSLKRLEREGYVLVLPSELASLLQESQKEKPK